MADLQDIHEGMAAGRSMDDYVVGCNDQVLKFHISQKLYGRSEQEQLLVQNYNAVSVGSVPIMLMLVHGYSGVILLLCLFYWSFYYCSF